MTASNISIDGTIAEATEDSVLSIAASPLSTACYLFKFIVWICNCDIDHSKFSKIEIQKRKW